MTTVQTTSTPQSRRSVRVPMQQKLRVRFDGSNDDIEAALLDLSVGGMLISCAVEVSVDSGLAFAFEAPGSSIAVSGRGRVAWMRLEGDTAGNEVVEAAIGVKFEPLPEAARLEVDRIVQTELSVKEELERADAEVISLRLLSEHEKKRVGDHIEAMRISVRENVQARRSLEEQQVEERPGDTGSSRSEGEVEIVDQLVHSVAALERELEEAREAARSSASLVRQSAAAQSTAALQILALGAVHDSLGEDLEASRAEASARIATQEATLESTRGDVQAGLEREADLSRRLAVHTAPMPGRRSGLLLVACALLLVASALLFVGLSLEKGSFRRQLATAASPTTDSQVTQTASADPSPPEVAALPMAPSTARETRRAAETQSTSPSPGEKPGNSVVAVASRQSSVREAVTRATDSWANAWSAQLVAKFLSHYSADFMPTQRSLDLASWRLQTRDRLLDPLYITVVLNDLVVDVRGDRNATVSFAQSFESDSYRDDVQKSLFWVLEGDTWKIVAEAVL